MVKLFGRYMIILPLFGVMFFLTGCNPDGSDPVISEQNYYPLRVGDYRIYEVEETQITPFNVEEVFQYEIKTLVTDSFQNSAGTYSYIMSRYKREDQTAEWQSLDTWTARVDSKEVVVNESNISFVKLSFPVQTKREWNGNAYNNEPSIEFCDSDFPSCDLYEFGEVKNSYETANGLDLDNTIEVIENNNPDLIVQYDVRKEIYAWQVGLVYREITVLKYCTAGGCSGQQLVQEGLVYKQELTEYGNQ